MLQAPLRTSITIQTELELPQLTRLKEPLVTQNNLGRRLLAAQMVMMATSSEMFLEVWSAVGLRNCKVGLTPPSSRMVVTNSVTFSSKASCGTSWDTPKAPRRTALTLHL